MSFAYAKKAAAATTSSVPTGWVLDWPFPTADGPWPPGWPLEATQDSPDPTVSAAIAADTLSLVVTLPATIAIGSSITVEVETQNSAASTSLLNDHLLQITASDGTSTVQVKKTSGGTYADAIYYQVGNYTGSKYGIQETVFFDLADPDDADATITVTATLVSIDETLTGTDTMTAESLAVTVFAATGDVLRTTEIRLFDITAGTWSVSTAIPTTTYRAAMANVDAVGYVTGSQDTGLPVTRLNSFTKSTAAWASLTGMSDSRYDHLTWAIAGKVYVAGSNDGGGAGSHSGGINDTEEYTIGTDSWTAKATLPGDRFATQYAAIGTDGYLMGGDSGLGTAIATGHKYDQTANSFSATASMSAVRRRGSGLTDGTDMWVTCGRDASAVIQSTEKYTVAGDAFSAATDAPNPVREFAGAGWSASDGYLAGGQNGGGSKIFDADSFSFASGTWTGIAFLPNTTAGAAGSGL